MHHDIALPMYDLHRPDTEALLRALTELLAARGIVVKALCPQEALLAHWRSDTLLLSQTCGFPLVTQLPDVQTVGCFHYTAPVVTAFTTVACWWYVRKTRDKRWRISAVAWWPVMLRIRNRVITPYAKWSRRWRRAGPFSRP